MTIQVGNDIEIDDIGNCCIIANTDSLEEFYLIIKTKLGWTEIIEYGPINPDLDIFENHMEYTYDKFEFSDKKISSRIDKFLNRRYYTITQAREATIDEIKPLIRSMVEII